MKSETVASSKKPSGRTLVVIAALTVSLVLIVAGAVWYVQSTRPVSSNTAPFDATFSGALAPASSSAASYSNDNSVLVSAVGFDFGLNESFNVDSLAEYPLPGCSLSVLWAGSSSLTIPGDPNGVVNGSAPLWFFIYEMPSIGFVGVIFYEGKASPLYSMGSSTCYPAQGGQTPIPSGIPDSKLIGSALWTNGGAEFLSTHADAQAFFSVGATGNATAPLVTWNSGLDTCPLNGPANATAPYVLARANSQNWDRSFQQAGDGGGCASLAQWATGDLT